MRKFLNTIHTIHKKDEIKDYLHFNFLLKSRLRKTKVILFYRYLLKLYFVLKYHVKKDWFIQTSGSTLYNRHPDLFKFSQDYFCKDTGLKILSFGCSSGYECFSLRSYFKNAEIIGCDVNKKSLETAVSINNDKNIKFIVSNEFNIDNNGPYDLIFALSVFCKEPECNFIMNISKIFPFYTFKNILDVLDQNLRIGGLLIIRNSNYRLEDTTSFINYKTLKKAKSIFPVFNSNGQRIFGLQDRGEIFEKVS